MTANRPSVAIALSATAVAEKGFCIGCGACTVSNGSAKIDFNEYGELTVKMNSASAAQSMAVDKVCPFSTSAPSESVLAEAEFAKLPGISRGEEVGFYSGLYAAYSHKHRSAGSSGGIATWLLGKLLDTNKVDKVIAVGRTADGDRFFDFKVISNSEELSTTATSFYYPVSYDRILKYVLENPGRYAITGVPCFHKALRQLKREHPLLRERIVYQIGIVCGQMKSALYLEYLTRRSGMERVAEDACFRRKNPLARADEYYFEASATSQDGEHFVKRIGNREIGANWGMGLFKPKACDFCDDVFAETADIAIMDAWLPKYVTDGLGTSLVVTRSAEINDILETARESELWAERVDEQSVMESQRGGLNHRRAGLRYRLALAAGTAVPSKRVLPHKNFGVFFKLEQKLRERLRRKSREAMLAQVHGGELGLKTYDAQMTLTLQMYRWLYRIKSRLGKSIDYRNEFRLDA
ncbi:hypothetical protein G8A07_20740 [Roseateles sp. DAIF2]|uniref:Coenzyme F420 hydrogenase/dehydrogenase, beta subunit C-terminal domain n=1 Tax=Roseateles sp. DAIF2 TaxID=2714952 RepID=UPI0018A284F9|nr:Coenzyme F420 hydrogenase/dehydrogenase, beta subunit C-terminal domain [Roseateles sp. DAIF2]QPF75102.1 hypothetical protein G8A07_20740 [Roseateles sp. DAIF2]